MGILLQAFMVLLLISTGIGALLTNFHTQKQNYLRQLESFDSQSFGSSLEKIFSNVDTCSWVFTGVDLSAPLPLILTGQEIKSRDSMGAEISLYSPGYVFSSMQVLSINFEVQNCGVAPVDPTLCSPGPPIFTRQLMIRWEAQSQMGSQRRLGGAVGPVLVQPIPVGGVSACRFFKGSGGGGGGGGNPLTCEHFGLVTSGTTCVGQQSIVAGMMADSSPPVNGPQIVNPHTSSDDFVIKTAWRFARDLSTRNALQGGRIRNIQTTGAGNYSFQTQGACALSVGTETCIAQLSINSTVYNNTCPNPGDTQWGVFLNNPLYRRICSATNPEPSLPNCLTQQFTQGGPPTNTCPIGNL